MACSEKMGVSVLLCVGGENYNRRDLQYVNILCTGTVEMQFLANEGEKVPQQTEF